MTAKAKRTQSAASGLAHSLRELGAGVGRAHQVVSRWVERPDWDQSRQPPWDIGKARVWAARTLRPDPAKNWEPAAADGGGHAPPDAGHDGLDHLRRHPLQAAKLKLTVVRAQKLEIEKALLTGELVSRAAVETALVRRAHAIRAAFEALPRQLAGPLVGIADENEIERVLAEGIRSVLTELSQMPVLPPAQDTEVRHV